MFERFTDRGRRVLVLAQEEARLMNHAAIGTEHFLLGLIHEGEGVAGQVLADAGVELGQVRDRVEERCPRGSGNPPPSPPFTPRAKKVLELSLREALQLGHNYIGTEHVLLGIIREGEGEAAIVLEQLGVSLSDARRAALLRRRVKWPARITCPATSPSSCAARRSSARCARTSDASSSVF